MLNWHHDLMENIKKIKSTNGTIYPISQNRFLTLFLLALRATAHTKWYISPFHTKSDLLERKAVQHNQFVDLIWKPQLDDELQSLTSVVFLSDLEGIGNARSSIS